MMSLTQLCVAGICVVFLVLALMLISVNSPSSHEDERDLDIRMMDRKNQRRKRV